MISKPLWTRAGLFVIALIIASATPPSLFGVPEVAGLGPTKSPCRAVHGAPSRLCESWRTHFSTGINEHDTPWSIATQGGIYATGSTASYPGTNLTTVSVDPATGKLRWQQSPERTSAEPSRGLDVVSTEHTTLVHVVGDISYPNGTIASYAGAYEQGSGAIVWDRILWPNEDTGTLQLNRIATAEEGTVIVAGGYSESPQGARDSRILAIDAHAGDILWERTYDSKSTGGVVGLATQSTSNRVYVLHDMENQTVGEDSYLESLQLVDGIPLWGQSYPSRPGWDRANALTILTSKNLAVVGGASLTAGTVSGVVAGFNASTGNTEWETTLQGDPDGTTRVRGLVSDNTSGAIFVTGQMSQNGSQGFVASLDGETGKRLWTQQVKGPIGGTDIGMDVVISPTTDEVFATFANEPPGPHQVNWDILTVGFQKFDGTSSYQTRYSTAIEGRDLPVYSSSIGISAQDDVVVLGQSDSSEDEGRWVFLSYGIH